jgi:hypothetical protein
VYRGGTIDLGTGSTSYSRKIILNGSTGKVGINSPTGVATLTVGGTIESDTVTTTGAFQISRAGNAVGLLSNTGSYLSNGLTVGQIIAGGITYPTVDGTSGSVLTTNGAGILSWTESPKVVAVPSSSADTGAKGQVAFGTGFFYFHDGTNWLQVPGNIF